MGCGKRVTTASAHGQKIATHLDSLATQGGPAVIHILSRPLSTPGVDKRRRGTLPPLGGYSLVTAPYAVDGRVLGVLGVIGPTRMAYERVIPVVQATARVLSSVMSDRGA